VGVISVKPLVCLVAFGALALSWPAAASPGAAEVSFGGVRHLGVNRIAGHADTQTSTNWAGYAVTHASRFRSVTGRWVQPLANCASGGRTFSAFWVGLGGFAPRSFGVEQTGTLANCSGGVATYRAWFELFPRPPVYVPLAVRAGDMLSATVSVSGKTVVVRLKNVTTGKLFRKIVRVARPDLGSAEWVAEAPTGCDFFGCTTLPLTNFGVVSFSHGSATITGHKGPISDPTWAETTIELHGDIDNAATAPVNAIPGALGPDGGSFAVTWQQQPPPPPAP
jgi:hypothetical protein